MDQKKVLLIEDDPFLRKLYIDILKEAGISLVTASDGQEGLTKIKEGGWDLILLDIILPKLDGLQVVKKLKEESPEMLKQRIVFLTNLDKDATINEVTNLGYGYLIKSNFTPEEFVSKIKSLI